MDQLFALSVTVPLLVAAGVLATRPLLGAHRRVLDLVAVLASASVAVMLLLLLYRTKGGDSTYWFAGFRPVAGVAVGVDFEAGPLSMGLACLGAILMTASLRDHQQRRRLPVADRHRGLINYVNFHDAPWRRTRAVESAVQPHELAEVRGW